MSITRTPYGTFVARWTDPYGRRSSRTFKTKADARAHLHRIYGDIARGDYTNPRQGRITLAAWADDWLEGARNLTRGGRDTYRRDLDRHILPILGRIPLGRLAVGDVDRYLTAKSVDLAPSTVHRHYRTLHRLLAVAVERGLIARNPCEHVHPPRIPRTEMTVLDADQVDALAAAITPRYRAWVYVMAYGGLRWAESVGLRRRHVDLPQLAVVEQLVHRGRGEWDRCEPKAGSRRTVTLPEFVATELKVHVETLNLQDDDSLVFCTRNGTPLQAPSFRTNIFRRALDKAGLPPIRVHDLRHTSVSLAIAAGANPKLSQARAGHSSIGIHLDRYGHLFPGADEAVAQALDELHATAQRGRLRVV
jgi:integrase